ncbi:MAG TPA: protein kinase [Bryobacteraceae bacterium]|jgi:serine/threonine protein kinase
MNPFQAREIWPPGTVVDRKYVIHSTLGRGGFGTVYLANHRVLGHQYVIKRLHSQFAEDPKFIDRFVKEAQAIAKLKGCPRIIEVFDMTQTDDGQLVLVMEYMPGGDLGALLESEPRLSLARAISYARQIAEALKAAHALGFVHRDVKPQNVLLTADRNAAKLTDFGIVTDRDSVRTTSVMRTGSEGFAAPEQWQLAGKLLDGRTDLYALGATLYLMLAGRMPYGNLDLRDWVSAIAAGPPPPLRSFVPEVPPDLDRLVMQLLEVDRDKRPSNAIEVITRLDACAGLPPIPIPHRETIVEAPRPEARTVTIQQPLKSPPAQGKSRLRLVPNALTVLRILFASEIFGNFMDDGFAAVDLFLYLGIFAALTDFFDGWFARRFNRASRLGALLDPVADALLIGGTFLMFGNFGWSDPSVFPWGWAATWMIIAQGAVSFIAGILLWRRNVEAIPAGAFSRICSTYQYLVFLSLLFGASRLGGGFLNQNAQTILMLWWEYHLAGPMYLIFSALALAMIVFVIRNLVRELRRTS